MTLRKGAAIGTILGGVGSAVWFVFQHSTELLTIAVTSDRWVLSEIPSIDGLPEWVIPTIATLVVLYTMYRFFKSVAERVSP